MYLLGDAAKISTKPCKTVNASSIPQEVRNTFKLVPSASEDRNPGYNKSCNCYYWGYRPEILKVLGLGSVYANEWNVCLDPQTSCPIPAVCPPATKCPPKQVCNCPAPTVCPPKTVCPPPVPPVPCPPVMPPPGSSNSTPVPTNQGAFGPTLGLLLAAGVVGGAGYYAWKKLKKK